jgi:hypothetical protein
LFFSPNIIRLITGKGMRLAGHDERRGKKGIVCAVLYSSPKKRDHVEDLDRRIIIK